LFYLKNGGNLHIILKDQFFQKWILLLYVLQTIQFSFKTFFIKTISLHFKNGVQVIWNIQ